MVSALKADLEDLQEILDLALEISDIPKGVLDQELLYTSKTTQIESFQ